MSDTALLGSAVTVLEVVFLAVMGIYAVGLFAIFIISVSNSKDQDARGTRPMAAYYFSASFIFLWATFVAVLLAVFSLIQLIGSHPSSYFAPAPNYNNEAIRACVLGAIFVLFAGGAFFLHLRRGTVLADTEQDASGPTKRVMRGYVAVTSFIAIVVAVVAAMVTVYLVFELISPSIFGGASDKTETVRALLDGLVVVLLAAGVFGFHQRFAPAPLRLLGAAASPLPAPPASPMPPTGAPVA